MENEGDPIPTLINPQQRLAGKVAIITGGASGIGAATAKLFHQHGAKVVIADIQDPQGQALAYKLGQNATYIHCDVSKEDQVINLIDQTLLIYEKLDIMYNNAGILGRPFSSFLETRKSDLDSLMSVNLVGAFLGAKYAARVMKRQRSGCILFTSSTEIGGLATQAYALTKHGILGLAKGLAAELAPDGIRVNCISPYGTATPMAMGRGVSLLTQALKGIVEVGLSRVGNLKGRVLRAEDVGRAALYLASDEANRVSGVNLVVDGAFSAVNPSLDRAVGRWVRFLYLIQRSGKTFGSLMIVCAFLVLLLSMIFMISI